MDRSRYTGYWGKFDSYIELHDEVILSAAVYAGLVSPVTVLNFNNYRVPAGKMLWIRSVTVRSPWHNFAIASMSCHLTSRNNEVKGTVDYAGVVVPVVNDVLVSLDAPSTLTKTNVIIRGGKSPVIYADGVPFPELVSGEGGVAADILGELVLDEGY